jgi:hypothetical protein
MAGMVLSFQFPASGFRLPGFRWQLEAGSWKPIYNSVLQSFVQRHWIVPTPSVE